MLNYKRKEANGFVWTSDTKLGVRGFTKHRLYVVSDRNNCLAVISRAGGLYILKLSGRGLSGSFGDLAKAKHTAENYVSKNFHRLGYELTKVVRLK